MVQQQYRYEVSAIEQRPREQNTQLVDHEQRANQHEVGKEIAPIGVEEPHHFRRAARLLDAAAFVSAAGVDSLGLTTAITSRSVTKYFRAILFTSAKVTL